MSTITLHDFELDDGCYKVRLFLSMLGVDYAKVPVNVFPGAAQRSPAYLRLNPLGALPILVDGGLVLHEPDGILAYLARRYDAGGAWLPTEPAAFGAVMMWLAFSSKWLAPASLARLNAVVEVEADAAAARKAARVAFRAMDDHMTAREFDGGEWFVGEKPTIADIALFPAIALSRDAEIEHDAYPALRRWMRRMRAIPGFQVMPGIPAYH